LPVDSGEYSRKLKIGKGLSYPLALRERVRERASCPLALRERVRERAILS